MRLPGTLLRLGAAGALVVLAGCFLLGCGPVQAGGAIGPGSGPGAPTAGGDPAAGGDPTAGGDPGPGAPPTTPPVLGSRCIVGPTINDVSCEHETSTIAGRTVLWETPLGTAPPGGWPLVIIYQGSLLSPDGQTVLAPHGMWMVTATDAAADGIFANYVLTQLTTETMVLKRLLDGGYAVVTPTADNSGFAWDTNLPPWLYDWLPAPDNQFLGSLFAAIEAGQLGPLSASRWYASGVSSGGYMTSRMAVSYPGRFRALAIAAGSYATCGGDLPCVVPTLPTDHPPTLFLHGGSDPFVPVAQMYAYYDALITLGCDTKAMVDASLPHGWIPESPDAIATWFDSH